MFNIFSLVNDATACGYYRKILPWNKCHEELKDSGINFELSQEFNINKNHDAIILHRLINPAFLPKLWDIKTNTDIKIVWDLDDNLFCVPSWSPAREMSSQANKESLAMCLELADWITVSTERLKNQLSRMESWKDKIVVLPNLINEADWVFPYESKNENPSNEVTTIVWAGSLTHSKDLDLIVDAVKFCLSKYSNSIEFVFFGAIPEYFATHPDKRIRFIAPNQLIYYPSTMNLISPDIAIIPIVECEFNQAKSNIKYLEMTMSGSVSIASDFGPYSDTVENNIDGFLVSTNQQELNFRTILSHIIYKHKLGHNQIVQENAINKVKSQYSWNSPSRNIWIDFFKKLAE